MEGSALRGILFSFIGLFIDNRFISRPPHILRATPACREGGKNYGYIVRFEVTMKIIYLGRKTVKIGSFEGIYQWHV